MIRYRAERARVYTSPGIVLAEMQNVFVSLRPESRYIFFKASPAHRIGPPGDAVRGAPEGERDRSKEKGAGGSGSGGGGGGVGVEP